MKPQLQILIVSFLMAEFAALLQAAQPNSPPAALMVLTRAGAVPDEFSSVVEIAKVELESAVALRVQLPTGQSLTIPNGEVGHLFWYPDPMSVLNRPADATAIASKCAEAADLARRFPKAKAICDRVIVSIDSDLQKLASGQIRIRGVWQSSTPASSSAALSPSSDLTILYLDGSSYKNVVIRRLENGSLLLQHDGGVVRVPLARAPAELLAKLYARPSLLEGYTPLDTFVVNGATLKRAVLAAAQDGRVLILHDAGTATFAKDTLTAAQLQLLASTAPPPPTIAAGAAPEAAASKAKLVLDRGEGPPRPVRVGESALRKGRNGKPQDVRNSPIPRITSSSRTCSPGVFAETPPSIQPCTSPMRRKASPSSTRALRPTSWATTTPTDAWCFAGRKMVQKRSERLLSLLN
jgi:hypothetical protein